MDMKKRQSGFTLIELLVVIAIIGILAVALFLSFSSILKSSKKSRATETVSNAMSALETLYGRETRWPGDFIKTLREGDCKYGHHYVMNENVAKVLAQHNVMSVDYKNGVLHGKDRCGIVDPWAGDVLERADKGQSGSALLDRSVPSGGKVRDHRLYFAVDVNEDGFVDTAEGAPNDKVRARAIVWCAGADGVLGNDGSKEAKDNVYSWKRAQEQRGK